MHCSKSHFESTVIRSRYKACQLRTVILRSFSEGESNLKHRTSNFKLQTTIFILRYFLTLPVQNVIAMKEAAYYKTEGDRIRCSLCPHFCLIGEGKRGICGVRKNIGGKLYSENWGQVSSLNFDPIEKKPLYHFYPGRIIFSVGSIGCNLHCKFCQNWEISQTSCEDFDYLRQAKPEELLQHALNRDENIGIAFTYNEPAIWFEFMLDTAKLAKERGLKNVMVSNGFITPEPLAELIEVTDAFSIDLKAFTEGFYKNVTGSHLEPVLEALKQIRKSGRHLEITNLIIPNQNDDPADFISMIDWIEKELGPDTVLHISRYYPTYKMNEPATGTDIMEEFYKIATAKLQYVYLGNIRSNEGQHTFCPNCKSTLILREGYFTKITGLSPEGTCKHCNHPILNVVYQ